MRGIKIIIFGLCAIFGLVGRQARAQVLAPEEIPFTQDVSLMKFKSGQLCVIQFLADKGAYKTYTLAVKTGKVWNREFPVIAVTKQDNSNAIEFKDIEFIGKRIYIAGNFKFYNSGKNCLVYLDRTSSSNPWKADHEFVRAGAAPFVGSITAASDFLYLGGAFTKIATSTGSMECLNIARIAIKNFAVQRILNNKNNGTDSTVTAMEYDTASKMIFVAGLFRKIAGFSFRAIAKLNPLDTSVIQEYAIAKGITSVYKMRQIGSKFYLFGANDSGFGIFVLNGSQVKLKGINAISFVSGFFSGKGGQMFLLGSLKLNSASNYSSGLFAFNETNGPMEIYRKVFTISSAESYYDEIYVTGSFKSIFYDNTLGRIVTDYQKFMGRVFADLDNNGSFSSGDKAIPKRSIRIMTNTGVNQLIQSGPGGYFSFPYPQIPVVFKVLVESQGDLSSSTQFIFRADTAKERIVDLPLKYIKNNYSDLTVRMTAATGWLTRNDTSEIYVLTVANRGLVDAVVPKLNLNFDRVQDIKTFPAHNVTNASSITWNNQSVAAGTEQSYIIKLTVPSKNYTAGQTIQFNTTMPGLVDDNPANNTDTLQQTVTKGVDPFLKMQNPAITAGDSFAWLIPSTGKVDYTIRFSNFGIDTVNTVVVKDTISTPDYVTYIQETGASHAFSRQVYTSPALPDKVIVVYTFPNIKLPPNPSGNSEVSSASGFIAFRVGFTPTLIPAGSSIRNRASIYMDYDAPVMTNMVIAKIPLTSVSDFRRNQKTFVFPNPCSDFVNFAQETIGSTLTICAMDGREIISQKISGNRMDLAGLKMAAGAYMYRITTNSGNNYSGILIKN